MTQHLHKYEKVILGKNGYTVFRCTIPSCNHYIRKELARGKMCSCNRCGEAMVLDARAMQLAKPHCENCIERKDKKKFNLIKEFVEAQDVKKTDDSDTTDLV